ITRVTGAVFGDESFFDDRRTAPGWKSWYYVNESPPLSALTVDHAIYRGRTSRNPALSAALSTTLRYMDHASDNFTAELLLKQLGTLVATPGTTGAGAAYAAQTLADAGVPMAGVR